MVKWEDEFKHYSINCLNELRKVMRQILTELQTGDLLSTRLNLAATKSGLLGFKPRYVRWCFCWLNVQELPGLCFTWKWYASLHRCFMIVIAGHATCEDCTASVKQIVVYYWWCIRCGGGNFAVAPTDEVLLHSWIQTNAVTERHAIAEPRCNRRTAPPPSHTAPIRASHAE
jgi:hypothetical protein